MRDIVPVMLQKAKDLKYIVVQQYQTYCKIGPKQQNLVIGHYLGV